MGGFRNLPLNVEMEHRFRTARALLGQAPPAGIAHACRAVAVDAVANEIDIGVILVGRPVALEIVEEGWPIRLEPVHFEIAQREREAVVDADQRRHVLGQPLHQPFGDALAGPVFARAWWWRNLDRRCVALGKVNAQALQACGWRFRAGVVDADISPESGQSGCSLTQRRHRYNYLIFIHFPMRPSLFAGRLWPVFP